MARNQYYKDYRVVERVDERGRLRRESEYTGDPYRCAAEGAALRKEKRRALAVCGLGFVLFVVALLPFSAAAQRAYVILPFVFSALPLGILAEMLFSLPADRPLDRRMADRLANRYPAGALFLILLPGFALAGEGAAALGAGGFTAGDGVFAACAAGLVGCGLYLFKKRRSFDTRRI